MPLVRPDRPTAGALFAFVVAFLTLSHLATAFRQQSVAATGRLFCGNSPASNVRVKLMDKDTGPDPDDELGAGYTDADGRFSLSGDTVEASNIDPQLKIYHPCNKGLNPCPIKWVLNIPDKYITSGTKPKNVFDLGDVNLEVEIEGQGFDCIH